MAAVPAAAHATATAASSHKLSLSSSFASSSCSGTPLPAIAPCRALRDAQALLGASMRRLRAARAPSTRARANPRQNARMYEKYEANRRAFGGEAFDPTEADARTLRQLLEEEGDVDEEAGAATISDTGPLLVDARRVAAMAAFYRVLPDEADDPAYAAATMMPTGGLLPSNPLSLLLSLSPSPPPLPPQSLPDCLSARDPPAAAELDARVRGGGDGVMGVRGAVVRPLDEKKEEDDEEEGDRWRRRAARALLLMTGGQQRASSFISSSSTAAFVLWDVESAPLPPDADPRAAARLLEALAVEAAAAATMNRGSGGDAPPPPPPPLPVRLSVFGTRPALARIPAAFVARYAVEGAPTSRFSSATAAAAAATAAAGAAATKTAAAAAPTSLGARCAAYYSSRGLLFAPARGAQPSLKYALRREGAEVVQVGEGAAAAARATTTGKRKSKKTKGSGGGARRASAAAAQSPADALADAAERLLRAHATARARALFEGGDEEGQGGCGGDDDHDAPPALVLVVVAGAGELEAAGLRRLLAAVAGASFSPSSSSSAAADAEDSGSGVVPLLVVSGGKAESESEEEASGRRLRRPIAEVSWEALLRRRQKP